MCFTLTHLYHAMANLSAKVQEKNQCANVLDLFYAQKVQFFLPITAGKGRKAICTEEKGRIGHFAWYSNHTMSQWVKLRGEFAAYSFVSQQMALYLCIAV